MKVSAFTFIKNGQILGYPFVQSIQSVLPIVDEFVVNVGESEDDTLMLIKSIESEKIRIIQSKWNDSMQDRGYVYGQQKMIAQRARMVYPQVRITWKIVAVVLQACFKTNKVRRRAIFVLWDVIRMS